MVLPKIDHAGHQVQPARIDRHLKDGPVATGGNGVYFGQSFFQELYLPSIQWRRAGLAGNDALLFVVVQLLVVVGVSVTTTTKKFD